MQASVNQEIGNVEDALSKQMTRMGSNVNQHIERTVGAFRKEVIKSMDALKAEMGSGFDQSSGN